ncbi:MAG: phosphotransferase [Pseudomonadota bacterium]
MRSYDPAQDFLRTHGWAHAQRALLAGDASARRYERITSPEASAILMVLPPDSAALADRFLRVTSWLRGFGFSAPEVYATETARGLILLEDLGDTLLLRLCDAEPSLERPLYEAAIDVLADLQSQSLPPDDKSFPAYDRATLLRESGLALDWYSMTEQGETALAEHREALETHLAHALDALAITDAVAVYRDYHAENLLWLPDRRGRARIGMLDYQDMLVGYPAYDVVSLLEDARRDVCPSLAKDMTARYVNQMALDEEHYRYAAALLSAQRNLKILGIFARLARRDGKRRYLGNLPRVWKYLTRDLAHPDLADLRKHVFQVFAPPEGPYLKRLANEAA